MRIQLFALAWIVSSCTVSVFAQDSTGTDLDTTDSKKTFDVTFGVGGGVTKFLGDVQDPTTTNIHLFGNRGAVDMYLGVNLSRSFNLYLNGIYGKLSGNENGVRSHRNFESEMLQIGVGVEYNFAGLYKNRLPVINPFINAGAYYSSYFNIATDLEDGRGQPYHYWNDGTIRDQQQTDSNLDDLAGNMVRDYKYETSLVNGSVHSFAASVGGGLDFHVSKALSVRFMSRYFFSFSDRVDGFDNGVSSKRNDGFFFNSISLLLNTTALDGERKDEEPIYKYMFDFSALDESADEDGDGIADLADLCAGTPEGVTVDKTGCPLDMDLDGVPDYKDEEVNTEEGAVVDANGVTVDYDMIAKKESGDGFYRIHWEKSLIEPAPSGSKTYTVNIGTDKELKSDSLEDQALMIPELRKVEINDSLTVYYVGKYKSFKEADHVKNELVDRGFDGSYSIDSSYSKAVSKNLADLSPEIEELRNKVNLVESDPIKTRSVKRTNPMVLVKPKFAKVDLNQDGLIQYLEVQTVLEDLEKEDSSFSGEYANELVAYYNQFGPVKIKGIPRSEISKAPVNPEFAKADLDKDGFIQLHEIHQIMTDVIEGNSSFDTRTVSKLLAYHNSFVDVEKTNSPAFGRLLSPKETSLREITRVPVKPEFKTADFNSDGLIEYQEIERVVQDVMVGKSTFDVESTNSLFTYFHKHADNTSSVLTTAIDEIGDSEVSKTRTMSVNSTPEFAFADRDKNGLIELDEMHMVVDDAIQGNSTISIETTKELFAYFHGIDGNQLKELKEEVDAGIDKTKQLSEIASVQVKPEYVQADFNNDGEIDFIEVIQAMEEAANSNPQFKLESVNLLMSDFSAAVGTKNANSTAVLQPKAARNTQFKSVPVRPEFVEADLNEDGDIDFHEIKQVMTNLLEGRTSFSKESFDELVSYYHESADIKTEYSDADLEELKNKKIESFKAAASPVKPEFVNADLDADGAIQFNEIQQVMVDVMKGISSFNQESLNELISYYYDFPELEELKLNNDVKSIKVRNIEKSEITSAPVKPEFVDADFDKNDMIHYLEVQRVMDEVVQGNSSFTVESFNDLVAYYTEFTQNVEPIDFAGMRVAYVDGKMTILTTDNSGDITSESKRLLARKFAEVDFNGDGELTPEEVQRMINLFQKGESPYSDQKIHELIDLYFD